MHTCWGLPILGAVGFWIARACGGSYRGDVLLFLLKLVRLLKECHKNSVYNCCEVCVRIIFASTCDVQLMVLYGAITQPSCH